MVSCVPCLPWGTMPSTIVSLFLSKRVLLWLQSKAAKGVPSSPYQDAITTGSGSWPSSQAVYQSLLFIPLHSFGFTPFLSSGRPRPKGLQDYVGTIVLPLLISSQDFIPRPSRPLALSRHAWADVSWAEPLHLAARVLRLLLVFAQHHSAWGHGESLPGMGVNAWLITLLASG